MPFTRRRPHARPHERLLAEANVPYDEVFELETSIHGVRAVPMSAFVIGAERRHQRPPRKTDPIADLWHVARSQVCKGGYVDVHQSARWPRLCLQIDNTRCFYYRETPGCCSATPIR